MTGSTWITYQGTREEYSPYKFLYKISCSQNDGSTRTGSITFTNNDGCTFTATVSQEGVSSYIATLTLNNGSTVDIEGSGSLVQSMIEPYRSTVVNADIKSTCSSLASDSFASCSSLTSVTIPSSVYLIGDNSFEGCINLTSITIPNGVGIITSLVFGRCSRLTSVTISNTVTSIGLGAFSNCRGLTSITFPSSITEIGMSVLAGCSGIGKITCNATTPLGLVLLHLMTLTDIYLFQVRVLKPINQQAVGLHMLQGLELFNNFNNRMQSEMAAFFL